MANHNNNVEVSYNVQTTVDAKHKLIADFKVTQKPNDLGELDHMAIREKIGTPIFFDIASTKTYNLYMPRIARVVAAGYPHHIT